MKEQTIAWVRLIIAAFILLILVLLTWPNAAKSETVKLPPPTPAKDILVQESFALPDIPRITCEQLKELIDKKAVLLLIDSRSEMMFEKEHLKGAMNIPNVPLPPLTEEIIKTRVSSLPKDQPITIYCDWPDDGDAAGLAAKLVEAGHKVENIRVLWKGLFRWLELGFPTEKDGLK